MPGSSAVGWSSSLAAGSAGAKGVVRVFVPGPFAVFGWGVEVEPALVEAFAEGVFVDPVRGWAVRPRGAWVRLRYYRVVGHGDWCI